MIAIFLKREHQLCFLVISVSSVIEDRSISIGTFKLKLLKCNSLNNRYMMMMKVTNIYKHLIDDYEIIKMIITNIRSFFHHLDARALKSERLAFQSCLFTVWKVL